MTYIIPVSNGLFEHRERLGAAIWEFLWCIDRTTAEEVDEAGERWGVVLGGVPVKHQRIAEELGSSVRTVKRNLAHLKAEEYIITVRAPYGEIIRVRKNKKNFSEKRSAKTVPSEPREGPNMEHLNGGEVPKVAHPEGTDMAHQVDKSGPSNKDLSVDSNLRQVVVVDEADRFIDSDPHSKFVDLTNRLEAAYCELHGVLGMYVRQKEIQAMKRMITGGMPLSFIIRNMQEIYKLKQEADDPVRGFVYYESVIGSAWEKELLKKEAAPPPVPPGKNQQQNKRTSYSPRGSNKPKLPVYKGDDEQGPSDEEYEAILQRARARARKEETVP